jgi:hypothetical protein
MTAPTNNLAGTDFISRIMQFGEVEERIPESNQSITKNPGRIDYNPSSSSAFAHISLCSSASLLSPLIDLPLDHKPLLARLDSNSSINSESVVKYI